MLQWSVGSVWEIMVADRDSSQYNFRMNALAGNIPGVKKAAW